MDQDDAGIFIMLAERQLFNEEFTLATTQLLLGYIEKTGSDRQLRREFETLPVDHEGTAELRRKLEAIEDSGYLHFMENKDRIKVLVSRMESGHEKLEAVVANLKKLFPPSS